MLAHIYTLTQGHSFCTRTPKATDTHTLNPKHILAIAYAHTVCEITFKLDFVLSPRFPLSFVSPLSPSLLCSIYSIRTLFFFPFYRDFSQAGPKVQPQLDLYQTAKLLFREALFQ